jgi:outer membrane protein
LIVEFARCGDALKKRSLQTRQLAGSGVWRKCLVITVCLFIAYPAFAAETLIGFVNIPYLIDKAPQAIEAAERLEKEFAPRQAAISELHHSINALKVELSPEEGGMTPDEREEIERQIMKLQRQHKREEQEFRERLNIRKNAEFKKIRLLVLDAINAFGQSRQYDLIVSDGVLYADKRMDVTEKILENLRLMDDMDDRDVQSIR